MSGVHNKQRHKQSGLWMKEDPTMLCKSGHKCFFLSNYSKIRRLKSNNYYEWLYYFPTEFFIYKGKGEGKVVPVLQLNITP